MPGPSGYAPAPGEGAPLISVCIVTGRRAPMLDACLESLQAQEDPPSFEILVVSDADSEVPAIVASRFADAPVALIPRANPGSARNVLIARARGEWLLFLDDDVTVERTLLRTIAALAEQHPEVDVLGGPNYTPRGSSRFEHVQGAVLATIVATGPVRRRYGAHPAGEADERFFTLCNLAIRRSVMLPFVDELLCAEENALLTELRNRHVRMHYDPLLLAYHSRREDATGFARQMYKYGTGRGQLIRRMPRTLRPSHVVPSLLVLYLVVSPFLVFLSPIFLAPAALYGAAVVVGTIKIARSFRRWSIAPLAAGLIVVVHVCYGTGVARGLLLDRWLRRRRARPSEPRWLPVDEPEASVDAR
jgi:succinoglycan biosynthesis protein ExoA